MCNKAHRNLSKKELNFQLEEISDFIELEDPEMSIEEEDEQENLPNLEETSEMIQIVSNTDSTSSVSTSSASISSGNLQSPEEKKKIKVKTRREASAQAVVPAAAASSSVTAAEITLLSSRKNELIPARKLTKRRRLLEYLKDRFPLLQITEGAKHSRRGGAGSGGLTVPRHTDLPVGLVKTILQQAEEQAASLL